MPKENLKKLLNCAISCTSEDFTPQEKMEIYQIFEELGMSNGTCYNRIFRDGFDAWEYVGAACCVRAYIYKEVPGFKEWVNEIFIGNSGQMSREKNPEMEAWLDLYRHPSAKFFNKLKGKLKFYEFMSEAGMSLNVARYRFGGWAFKKWEEIGLLGVLTQHFGFALTTEDYKTLTATPAMQMFYQNTPAITPFGVYGHAINGNDDIAVSSLLNENSATIQPALFPLYVCPSFPTDDPSGAGETCPSFPTDEGDDHLKHLK